MPFPTLGDLPDPGIEPVSLAPPAVARGFFTTLPPGKSTIPQTPLIFKVHANPHANLLFQGFLWVSIKLTNWGCHHLLFSAF